ncbi:hypothetical protein ACS3SW_14300 [Roseobacteraceae bacterium S113]
MQQITLTLPDDLYDAAITHARAQDESLGHILRRALKNELRPAKPRNCANEQLVARLQRRLARDMASATDWHDLEASLAREGFGIQPAGGGLILVDASGARLCKTSELGFGYAHLVRRFGAAMPGHPHKMAHMLTKKPSAPEEINGDFEVIERISPFSELRDPAAPQSAPR